MQESSIETAVRGSIETNFSMMLGCTVDIDAVAEPTLSVDHCTSMALGSPDVDAGLHLLLPANTARHLVSAMLGDPEPCEELLRDGLGEVGNLLAGGVKSSIGDQTGVELILGLPTVLSGEDLSIAFPREGTVQTFKLLVDGEFAAECTFFQRVRNNSAAKAKTLEETS